jgi:chaperonin GroEL
MPMSSSKINPDILMVQSALDAAGCDARRKEYVDLIEAGSIDPTKVVRIALENTISIASILLLMKATMKEIPNINKECNADSEMAM